MTLSFIVLLSGLQVLSSSESLNTRLFAGTFLKKDINALVRAANSSLRSTSGVYHPHEDFKALSSAIVRAYPRVGEKYGETFFFTPPTSGIRASDVLLTNYANWRSHLPAED